MNKRKASALDQTNQEFKRDAVRVNSTKEERAAKRLKSLPFDDFLRVRRDIQPVVIDGFTLDPLNDEHDQVITKLQTQAASRRFLSDIETDVAWLYQHRAQAIVLSNDDSTMILNRYSMDRRNLAWVKPEAEFRAAFLDAYNSKFPARGPKPSRGASFGYNPVDHPEASHIEQLKDLVPRDKYLGQLPNFDLASNVVAETAAGGEADEHAEAETLIKKTKTGKEAKEGSDTKAETKIKQSKTSKSPCSETQMTRAASEIVFVVHLWSDNANGYSRSKSARVNLYSKSSGKAPSLEFDDNDQDRRSSVGKTDKWSCGCKILLYDAECDIGLEAPLLQAPTVEGHLSMIDRFVGLVLKFWIDYDRTNPQAVMYVMWLKHVLKVKCETIEAQTKSQRKNWHLSRTGYWDDVFLLDGPKKALIERMDKAVLDVFQWLKVNDIPITLRKAARVSL
jgi:hypothetical protein